MSNTGSTFSIILVAPWRPTQPEYDAWRDAQDRPAQPVARASAWEIMDLMEFEHWRLCGAPALDAAERWRTALALLDASLCDGPQAARQLLQRVVEKKPQRDWSDRTIDAMLLWSDESLFQALQRARLALPHHRERALYLTRTLAGIA